MSGKSGSTPNFFQKWKLDTNFRRDTVVARSDYGSPPNYGSGPAGVAHHVAEAASRDSAEQQHLLTKRAWDMALGPMKQLPMNLFIMYMAGNSISIFPIMMVGMMCVRPIKALISIGGTFKQLEQEIGSRMILQKAAYILGNLLGVALALYKCHSMGLLPTHASDWLDFVEEPERMEFSGGGLMWS